MAFADRLLLNKIDLVPECDLGRVEERLRGINRYAPVVRCQNAQVAMEQVLGINAFELERVLEMDPVRTLLPLQPCCPCDPAAPATLLPLQPCCRVVLEMDPRA